MSLIKCYKFDFPQCFTILSIYTLIRPGKSQIPSLLIHEPGPDGREVESISLNGVSTPGLWTKSCPLPVFVNKVLLEHRPSFTYILSMVASHYNWVVVTETMKATKPKIFTPWALQTKFVGSCSRDKIKTKNKRVNHSLSNNFLKLFAEQFLILKDRELLGFVFCLFLFWGRVSYLYANHIGDDHEKLNSWFKREK